MDVWLVAGAFDKAAAAVDPASGASTAPAFDVAAETFDAVCAAIVLHLCLHSDRLRSSDSCCDGDHVPPESQQASQPAKYARIRPFRQDMIHDTFRIAGAAPRVAVTSFGPGTRGHMHATTGDFLTTDDWMDVYCPNCRRTVWIKGDMIRKRFPVSIPIAEAEKRLRCKCGHRGATIRIKPPFPHQVEGDKISFGGRLA